MLYSSPNIFFYGKKVKLLYAQLPKEVLIVSNRILPDEKAVYDTAYVMINEDHVLEINFWNKDTEVKTLIARPEYIILEYEVKEDEENKSS
jgi:hypothetical protein